MSIEAEFQAIVEIVPEVVKDSSDEEFIGYFEGVASTPQIDLEGDAFTVDVLQANAERLKEKPILFGHGKDQKLKDMPVGKILDAWVENGILKIRAGIYKQFGDIWEKIKSGVLKGLSVGGIARKIRRETVNVIEDAEISEVSLAPRPVNPSAQIYNVFGKSFMVEDGVLTTIAKIDFDLPIVERKTWDGDAAAQRIFEWAEKEDGGIDRSKASKLFLVVEGDGTRRGDYSWPVGDIVDGKPVIVSSGVITAIKYAAGARGVKAPEEVKRALKRLARRLVEEGILPEDYEVPWEREEKALLEDTILRFWAIEKKLEDLEDGIRRWVDERVAKAEEKFKPVEKGVAEDKKPRATVAGEEVVRKTPSPGMAVYSDGQFMQLLKSLRKIN
ncbi:MAG: hypothetical protein QXU87_04015 [Candidatus Caldarchaeum sp.]